MNFDDLGLVGPILRAVRDEGYETATPIQEKAIPQVIEGRDLIGCAQTGTGKTAAFALPTLQRLLARGNRSHAGGGKKRTAKGRKIRALVLSPTRELAAQIGESFSAYGRFTGLRNTVIYGGVSQKPQVRFLQKGVDILVATPGRLLDLVNQGYVDLRGVEILILDEADRMLDMGFIPDIRRIVANVPRERQTLMFSATMPEAIRKLAAQWLRDPVRVQVAADAAPAERVKQSVYFVEPRRKPRLLSHFLKNTPSTRTLVFSRTKHGADKIVKVLSREGIRAAAIHGNKSQAARQRVLAEFKSDRLPVLIATDVAARGLDVDDISHVINYDMPHDAETYVHRIGRTGRAGAEGIAVSFCGREEHDKLRSIERLIRSRIAVREQPDCPREEKGRGTERPPAASAHGEGGAAAKKSKPGRRKSRASGRQRSKPKGSAQAGRGKGAGPGGGAKGRRGRRVSA